MQLDRTMYLVLQDHRGGPYFPETDLDRTDLVRVCKDLRDGQYANVIAVFEINPEKHICRDATHLFREVINADGD